jgi:hypothetical protein
VVSRWPSATPALTSSRHYDGGAGGCAWPLAASATFSSSHAGAGAIAVAQSTDHLYGRPLGWMVGGADT